MSRLLLVHPALLAAFAALPAAAQPTSPPPMRQGTIGTVELPPSSALGTPGEIVGEESGAASGEEVPDEAPAPRDAQPDADAQVDAGADAGADADAAWAAMLEERRRKVNEVEAPAVARLNAEAARAQRRTVEAAEAEQERRLAEHQAQLRRGQAEHRAALERHRRAVAEQRARYQACLDGVRAACPPL